MCQFNSFVQNNNVFLAANWSIFKKFMSIDIYVVPAIMILENMQVVHDLVSTFCIYWLKIALFLQNFQYIRFKKSKFSVGWTGRILRHPILFT